MKHKLLSNLLTLFLAVAMLLAFAFFGTRLYEALMPDYKNTLYSYPAAEEIVSFFSEDDTAVCFFPDYLIENGSYLPYQEQIADADNEAWNLYNALSANLITLLDLYYINLPMDYLYSLMEHMYLPASLNGSFLLRNMEIRTADNTPLLLSAVYDGYMLTYFHCVPAQNVADSSELALSADDLPDWVGEETDLCVERYLKTATMTSDSWVIYSNRISRFLHYAENCCLISLDALVKMFELLRYTERVAVISEGEPALVFYNSANTSITFFYSTETDDISGFSLYSNSLTDESTLALD